MPYPSTPKASTPKRRRDLPAAPERVISFSGRVRSFSYALSGIVLMLRSQRNAWIHGVATMTVVGAGLAVGLTASEWCWITLSIVSVWVAEALNTALEFLTDLASPDFHPLAGRAKDVAAGAVLIAAAGATLIAALVFGPHVLGTTHGG